MTVYYTPTGNPPSQARGTSATIRTEFVAVQAGFAAVNGEMVLKAPLASPPFTGTPTAPTAAAGTNTTQLATTAFVVATSLNASLPGQGGNSGKFITTNGTSASWAALPPTTVVRSARTSSTILAAADNATLVDVTSGTFSQTFTACATLGAGWWCYIRNSGTGDVTLDPNAAETIDGLATFIMYPGEARLIQCDGAALRSVVLSPFSRIFTASGTWTKPPGYARIGYVGWGGGGSGRKDSAAADKTGGVGGSCIQGELLASTLGTTETITIGAGGLAQTVNATNGNAGGDTSFGSWATAFGGAGGSNVGVNGASAFVTGITFANSAVIGGATSNVHIAYLGSAQASTSAGIKSVWGSAPGGTITSADALINDAVSLYGGATGIASVASNGSDGGTPGGGGGATKTGTQSGAGARGELRVWGVA